jgi:methylated-DNA-[protein]-cysteine S-methyltransferase
MTPVFVTGTAYSLRLESVMKTITDYNAVMELPTGMPSIKLGICVAGKALTRIDYLPATLATQPADNPLATEIVRQLNRYFENPHHRFTLPLQLAGSEFQQRIWRELQQLGPGEVSTYGALAGRTQSSARAVGGACRANPIPIVVPCHRIVAKSGAGGYSGETGGEKLQVKQWLLQHECTGQFHLAG